MPMTDERIRLGISACLLGEPVRFDGAHKRDPFLVESLGQFVDWVPVCPEVARPHEAPPQPARVAGREQLQRQPLRQRRAQQERIAPVGRRVSSASPLVAAPISAVPMPHSCRDGG
jgi:uncharacterized protein YbbK (DUF523 family)